jgi:hypothetical protein
MAPRALRLAGGHHAVTGDRRSPSTLRAARHFDPLRGEPAFEALLEQAEAGRANALAAFREAGGERLLGRA